MVRAISAAPCALASGTTTSALSRPASRLIELTIARPGICSSAARITSGSVESTWIGAGWVEGDPLHHRRHLLVLVLALGQRHADVEHVGAAVDLVLGDLDQAVVVVGEEELLRLARALRVDPLADQRRRGSCTSGVEVIIEETSIGPGAGRSPGTRPATRSRIARMWSGVVPQQPPTMPTP